MAVLLLAPSVLAQNAPVPPSCNSPEFRQFDFWVGDWEVKSGAETVGYSRIEKAVRDCALIENWTGVDGDTGKSLNFYDRATSKWRQVYVGPRWNLDYRGSMAGADMVFRSSRKLADGVFQLRLTFTPLPGGQVRQHKEQSADGAAWKDVYDFRYLPRHEDAPAVSIKPACTSGPWTQFNFWVGDWDVYSGPQLAGRNNVQGVVAGCLVFENWTGAKGGEGKSFNFYDADRDEWRQVWIAPGGNLDLHGSWRDGALRYTGETARANGARTLERLTFTPRGDGSVRQFWEQSNDSGKTWTVAFDGIYVPRGTKPSQ